VREFPQVAAAASDAGWAAIARQIGQALYKPE